jgi:hypothetical protein
VSTTRKLEKDFACADLAAVSNLLSRLGDEDVMARMGLEARREELRGAIARLDDAPDEETASAALFFGGAPVVGTRGIETTFATEAIGKFQDLVSKVLAHEAGGLAQRGVVPHRDVSTLHITQIVRGSFGFLLEEMQPAQESIETSLRTAVDEATRILDAFGESDEEQFRSTAEGLDERLLATTRDFFGLMHESGATFRLVAGKQDHSFGEHAVAIAAERASTTNVEESEESSFGKLIGTLPDSHVFEFVVKSGEVIRGKVQRSLTRDQLLLFNRTLIDVEANVRWNVKRVRRSGAIVRESYTLTDLERAVPQLPDSGK